MDTRVFDAPAMYADHHVIEVRRLLLELPGVDEVVASSAFRTVEVHFDPDRASAEALQQRLDEAGYLTDPALPQESGKPAVDPERDGERYFRHTAVHTSVARSIGFEQGVAPPGRPLWSCPGIVPATAASTPEDG